MSLKCLLWRVMVISLIWSEEMLIMLRMGVYTYLLHKVIVSCSLKSLLWQAMVLCKKLHAQWFQWCQHGSIPGLIADKTQQDHYTYPLLLLAGVTKLDIYSFKSLLCSVRVPFLMRKFRHENLWRKTLTNKAYLMISVCTHWLANQCYLSATVEPIKAYSPETCPGVSQESSL